MSRGSRTRGSRSRERGKGTVRQVNSGRFIALAPRTIDPYRRNVGGPGHSYATRQEAQDALDEAIYLHRIGALVFADAEVDTDTADDPVEDRTVSAVTEKFLSQNSEGAGALQPTTVRGYRSDRNRVVCHPDWGIGERNVDELTAEELTEWRTRTLPAAGVSKHMIAGGWRFLSSALAWDVETAGGLTVNPCALSTQSVRPRRRAGNVADSQPRRVVIPTWQEEMNLVRTVSDQGQRLLLLVLMRTGARFGEVASIEPDTLNPRDNAIHISRQWKRSGPGQWGRYPLKSGRPRDLRVPGPLMRALVDWRRTHDSRFREQLEAMGASGERRDVLFPYVPTSRARGGSGVWEASTWRRNVMVPAREAAVLPDLRTKDLRRIAASNFHDAGFSDAQVRQLLGHSEGSAVTFRHYVRPTDDEHSAMREAIRLNPQLSVGQRLDALWDAWVEATGFDPLADHCGGPVGQEP